MLGLRRVFYACICEFTCATGYGAPFDHYHNYYIEHEIKIFSQFREGIFSLFGGVAGVCVCAVKEGRIRTFFEYVFQFNIYVRREHIGNYFAAV